MERFLHGELRREGNRFELWDQGRRVGDARPSGDHWDVYAEGAKRAELHPRGDNFDVLAGPFWGKTGEIRRHGHDYHVYERGSRVREIRPSGTFGAAYDVVDVSQPHLDYGDELIVRAATGITAGAGALLGVLLGAMIEGLFAAAARMSYHEAPHDEAEPVFRAGSQLGDFREQWRTEMNEHSLQGAQRRGYALCSVDEQYANWVEIEWPAWCNRHLRPTVIVVLDGDRSTLRFTGFLALDSASGRERVQRIPPATFALLDRLLAPYVREWATGPIWSGADAPFRSPYPGAPEFYDDTSGSIANLPRTVAISAAELLVSG